LKAIVESVDQPIRTSLGGFLILSWMLGWMSGTSAIVLGIVGLIFTLTVLIGLVRYTL